MFGVIHYAVGFADATCGVNFHDRGKSGSNDLLICLYYPLKGLATGLQLKTEDLERVFNLGNQSRWVPAMCQVLVLRGLS